MKELICLAKIEYLKIIKYSTAKTLLILHFSLFLAVLFIFSRIDLSFPGFNMNKLYRFPGIWTSATWLASWFNLLLGILIIVLMGNEFAFQTLRQQVINGLSRENLLTGKILVILAFSIYGFILVLLSSIIFGFIGSSNHALTNIFNDFYNLLLYFLQAYAYMSLALLLCLIFRNTALSIVLFILYRFIVEPLLRLTADASLRHLFPIKAIGDLTPGYIDLLQIAGTDISSMDISNLETLMYKVPVWQNVLVVFVYAFLFNVASWYILKQKNL